LSVLSSFDDPQAYGRTAADDAGFKAAFLAKEIGRPVRVQWMRQEATAWDTKGPAYAIRLPGGLDAQGSVTALDYDARAADHNHVGYNEHDTVLIAQLTGQRKATPARGGASMPSEMYAIPNRRMATHVVGLPLVWETPLRTGNLRDPNGPQVTFASESFIDELAAVAGANPVEFRMRMLTADATDDSGFKRARSIAVVRAAAEAYGWDARPSPRRVSNGEVLTGRGIAYAYRNQTVVAVIAEVEVNRRTGRVFAKRFVCAHDCGLVVNPEALRRTLEGGTLHSLSRALHEEVRFDREKVTSVDWTTYPTLTHADTPESIDIVLVNGDPNPDRPDLPHYGAGESVCKPVIAAVANAIFDATGVRLRRVPFRSARVRDGRHQSRLRVDAARQGHARSGHLDRPLRDGSQGCRRCRDARRHRGGVQGHHQPLPVACRHLEAGRGHGRLHHHARQLIRGPCDAHLRRGVALRPTPLTTGVRPGIRLRRLPRMHVAPDGASPRVFG
jgi:CO/xanthine dehydrogenase Mo-binding subunit